MWVPSFRRVLLADLQSSCGPNFIFNYKSTRKLEYLLEKYRINFIFSFKIGYKIGLLLKFSRKVEVLSKLEAVSV